MQDLVFRASGVGALMVGSFGITDKQEEKLQELLFRHNGGGKPLTDNMVNELQELIRKKENPDLSETAKKFIRESVITYKTGRRKEIKSKYLEKGILVEQDSVDLFLDVSGEFYDHRTKREKNDFFTGECDLIGKDTIVDIKSSFDIFTFHEADFKDLYYWQGQVYCDLYDKKHFKLAYCLVNTPKPIFNNENQKLLNKYGNDTLNEDYVRELKNLVENCFFSGDLCENEIPKEDRVKVYSVDRNENDLNELKERVKHARNYAEYWWENRHKLL